MSPIVQQLQRGHQRADAGILHHDQDLSEARLDTAPIVAASAAAQPGRDCRVCPPALPLPGLGTARRRGHLQPSGRRLQKLLNPVGRLGGVAGCIEDMQTPERGTGKKRRDDAKVVLAGFDPTRRKSDRRHTEQDREHTPPPRRCRRSHSTRASTAACTEPSSSSRGTIERHSASEADRPGQVPIEPDRHELLRQLEIGRKTGADINWNSRRRRRKGRVRIGSACELLAAILDQAWAGERGRPCRRRGSRRRTSSSRDTLRADTGVPGRARSAGDDDQPVTQPERGSLHPAQERNPVEELGRLAPEPGPGDDRGLALRRLELPHGVAQVSGSSGAAPGGALDPPARSRCERAPSASRTSGSEHGPAVGRRAGRPAQLLDRVDVERSRPRRRARAGATKRRRKRSLRASSVPARRATPRAARGARSIVRPT